MKIYASAGSLSRVHRATLGIFASLCPIVASPAHGDVISTIQTPPSQVIEDLSTSETLYELSLANLIATNCEIEGVKAGDAALIAGTAQTVASHMGLSVDDYFSTYLQPALQEISAPDACEKHAETTRDIALKLQELGGSVIE
ncbi:hypothetical protein SAMN04489859_106713 [Paracoccus alcaliphilus]|uniref:Uncharacterized protein n=1 Tax=Paracoccus alcaliphilus TaxID=34002 RepID=A0A1H8NQ85_9RHOB|nr:hypothetical protein [Paracoccus alcaliphilus]WCR19659.1 hypothetical protein JHW40_08450 [Paracoccus alcaliphilus]SEO31730.1 hypothetical protein SAMN04489859_106713 [Paracoccus alcaliphilus]